MKHTTLLIIVFALLSQSCLNSKKTSQEESREFDQKRDLLLVHYDCKTDVDDLQSVAAFATLISNPEFSKINYHAVAGAYGTQGGLYVPPNELFRKAFGTKWSDAHTDREKALKEVKLLALATLDKKGDVWIADAGQSDFSAALVKAIRADQPDLKTVERIHIVQHSSWNEKVTSSEALSFVKKNAHYQKIPDGNATGNGTPGFRSEEKIDLEGYLTAPNVLATWQLAIQLSDQYNGQEDRYLNQAIAAGGLDFSDFSEVCWILGLKDIEDGNDFFRRYAKW